MTGGSLIVIKFNKSSSQHLIQKSWSLCIRRKNKWSRFGLIFQRVNNKLTANTENGMITECLEGTQFYY